MAIDTKYVRIEGYKDNITNYEFRLEDIKFDGNNVSATLVAIRHQDSAYMSDCEQRLYINGKLVDESTGSPFSAPHGSSFELSGPASGGEELIYEFYSPYWHGDAVNIDNWEGYVRFETKVPEISTLVNIKGIDKPKEPRQNEQWKFDILVENTTGNKLTGIDILVEVADESGNSSSEVQEVDLEANTTTTLRLWSGDIKSMLNVAKLERGNLEVCASVK